MKIKFQSLTLILSLLLATSAVAMLKPGVDAPDFTAKNLNGQPLKLSELKGTLLLVEMGTTWCPSCNEQARQIDKMHTYLQEKNIKTIAVFLADSPDSIRAHYKDQGLLNPDQILIDSGEARNNYGIFSIPRLLLIDEKFKIVFDDMVLTSDEIKRKIEVHLSQQKRQK